MGSAILAVLGTLAGAALATFTQRATERAARTERREQAVTTALLALLEAALRYREHHWLTVAHQRNGHTETPENLAERYRLRTDVTVARDRLALVARDTPLVALGEKAAWAALELSDIPLGTAHDGHFDDATEAALTTARDHSRDTHTALRNAGSDYLATQ
jgi:hypothetical protein